MGGKRDLKNRATSKRLDDAAHGKLIESAWTLVYSRNYAVNSAAVDRLLTEESLVPTRVSFISLKDKWLLKDLQNAFSTRLVGLGFDVFGALVVDLMHEFELGVWKGLFIHLVRLLNAIDTSKVVEMDRRYVFEILTKLV